MVVSSLDRSLTVQPCDDQESEGGVSARALDRHRKRRARWPWQMTPRTGRAAKSSTGVALHRSRVNHPISLAKSATKPVSISKVILTPDGRQEHPGALSDRYSSEGSANPLSETDQGSVLSQEGRFRPISKHRRARVHRVRQGRLSRPPEQRDRPMTRPRRWRSPEIHRSRPGSTAQQATRS